MAGARRGGALLLIATVAAALAACATPVGVNRVDSRTLHHELSASVLSQAEPSAPTRVVLERLALGERYEDEPVLALAELHALLEAPLAPDLLFALSELSFLHAEAVGSRAHFLAAAIYAYTFLLPGSDGIPPEPYDPRLRIAADVYNLALAEALKGTDRSYLQLQSAVYLLPFGSLEVRFDPSELFWADHPLKQLEPAALLEVRGLRNRYRRPGLGAPLVSGMSRPLAESKQEADVRRIPPGLKIPVTGFLRLEDPSSGILDGALRGELELYTPDEADEVHVNGRRLPLEFETTVALAASLEGAAVWELENTAFFSGDFRVFRKLHFDEGLLMLHPYDPDRIPVVMVHGTASSVARWSELINELENDPELLDRIQIWLFTYNTGNPIPYSAGLLHEALAQVVDELDPEGESPALRKMVVIGHSQGGLLTKMTAVSSGDRFWDLVNDRPLDSLELPPDLRQQARRSFFYEALPFVRRLVFIATPHRGSYLTAIAWAGFNPAKLLRRVITLPVTLVTQGIELTQWSDEARVRRASEQMPTSIDQMTPGNSFLEALASLPVAPGVEYHSIIAIRGDGPPEQGEDGVVKYRSAHLDGAESEKVVRSWHSTLAHPATIEEVRRILRAHVNSLP
jgi:pimeloyl-ACP methyl ester carboxylesterase